MSEHTTEIFFDIPIDQIVVNEFTKGTFFETITTTRINSANKTCQLTEDEYVLYLYLTRSINRETVERCLVDPDVLFIKNVINLFDNANPETRKAFDYINFVKDHKYEELYWRHTTHNTISTKIQPNEVEYMAKKGYLNIYTKNRRSLVVLTCFYGFEQLAIELIEKGYSTTEIYDDCTLLILACDKKLPKLCLHILTKDCLPHFIDKSNNTALIYACNRGFDTVALKLLETDCKPNHVGGSGYTALMWACTNISMENVALKLILMDSNVLYVNNKGKSALNIAYNTGLKLVALTIIKKYGKECNIKNKNTLLLQACQKNDEEMVLELLNAGCDPDCIDSTGCTPLIHATYNGMFAIVSRLLTISRNNIDYVNNNGETALLIACSNKYNNTAVHLLLNGCKAQHINKNNDTALILACRNNMELAAINILKTDCRPEHVDNYGNTALMLACRNGMETVSINLLSMNCKPDQINKTNSTALLYALHYASSKSRNVALELLKLDCSHDHVDDDGATPLLVACYSGFTDVVDRLLSKGCNIKHANKRGDSAIQLAVKYKHSNIALKLIQRGALE